MGNSKGAWTSHLRRDVCSRIKGDPFWEPYLEQWEESKSPPGVHLAIFVEPYLRLLLEGSKTIESRFSVHRCAPYEKVNVGDVLILKRSGGPVVGLCQVSETLFYALGTVSLETIRAKYATALCAEDPAFWQDRKKASYATLLKVERPRTVEPLNLTKRDRRGWVVLASGHGLFP